MKQIVVLPTYNERENLAALVAEILQQPAGWHILVVDDNSPDGTGELAEALGQRYPGKLFVMHRKQKEGLGRAYLDAFRHLVKLDYDVIVQMDADLSHSPAYLGAFLERIETSDLVLGSRYLHGINVVNWDFKRLLLSKLANGYVRLVTGLPFSDLTGGFKAWRREALRGIGLDSRFANGYLFQIETTYQAHRRRLAVSELPIIFHERNLGDSKIDWMIIAEALFGVLRLGLSRFVGRRDQAWREERRTPTEACAPPRPPGRVKQLATGSPSSRQRGRF